MTERIFKADGLVLRTRALGESDRLVTLLTWQAGKLEAVARGARKTKSKLAAGVDIFSYGRFTFYRGKTWPTITGQETLERFNWFREDPDRYQHGLYMAELTEYLFSGEEPTPEICQLLLDGWRMLGEVEDLILLRCAFELKLAHYGGYSPCLDSCVLCSSTDAVAFSPMQGGLLCPSCRSADKLKIEPGTAVLAARLIEFSLSQVKTIRVSNRQKDELDRITTSFLAYHLDLGTVKSRRLLYD